MAGNAQEIIALEKRFWQSMVDKDPEAAATMIAAEGLVTGPAGAMRIDPETYKKMTREGDWSVETFDLQDVAVVAYKVRQTGAMKGRRMDLNCIDSSTWVRDGTGWKCALHTETIAGHMPLTN